MGAKHTQMAKKLVGLGKKEMGWRNSMKLRQLRGAKRALQTRALKPNAKKQAPRN
jgi:hypothetical protein